jgi:hypothetical protein
MRAGEVATASALGLLLDRQFFLVAGVAVKEQDVEGCSYVHDSCLQMLMFF